MNGGITNEFSFILGVTVRGIGVFATHHIKKGTYLRLFGDKDGWEKKIRLVGCAMVPNDFQNYCVKLGDDLVAPDDFGCMFVGWYLNHSENPNAFHKDFVYYACADIVKGEEVTINYRSLGESVDDQEPFYKNV